MFRVSKSPQGPNYWIVSHDQKANFVPSKSRKIVLFKVENGFPYSQDHNLIKKRKQQSLSDSRTLIYLIECDQEVRPGKLLVLFGLTVALGSICPTGRWSNFIWMSSSNLTGIEVRRFKIPQTNVWFCSTVPVCACPQLRFAYISSFLL